MILNPIKLTKFLTQKKKLGFHFTLEKILIIQNN